ncbi:MAG: hypothetical protein C3F13_12365 [Anaerolineales bacterium]|nr:site-2 protease family protein [Anaerolineae bacterium]PWB52064.1 MAG: hypothetical protein C3F13_12365 [Anaerolineales bacterium]
MTIQLIIEFAIGLVVLIFVHEFGHFIVCKAIGIQVEEFGFGYPPRALTLFEHGGTKYTINWLPFGGFVRPKGESDPNVEGGMMAAHPFKRILMLLAGPIMNLLTAFILFYLVFAIIGSMPDRSRVELVEVVAGLPAAQAGLQAGDVIVSIDGVVVHSQEEAQTQIYSHLGEPLNVVFIHDGITKGVTVTPLAHPGSSGAIGVLLSNPMKPFEALGAIPESATSLYDYGTLLFSTIGQAISGQTNASEVRPVGLKGMYDMYSYIVRSPTTPGIPKIANVFQFFAIISFSLGIMNLLPIPPLDGGKILFALPELIFHKRIPIKYEVWVSSVAFILLIILMLYINAQDFINPILTPTP